jgi:hypothetical protein
MPRGRKPINGERLKPNGLPKELDDWYLAEGKRRGMDGAKLKRQVLEDFRQMTVAQQATRTTLAEVPHTLVNGE